MMKKKKKSFKKRVFGFIIMQIFPRVITRVAEYVLHKLGHKNENPIIYERDLIIWKI